MLFSGSVVDAFPRDNWYEPMRGSIADGRTDAPTGRTASNDNCVDSHGSEHRGKFGPVKRTRMRFHEDVIVVTDVYSIV